MQMKVENQKLIRDEMTFMTQSASITTDRYIRIPGFC